jgi:cyclophilin family peptidyl-prolyl cis-trans isomerase
VGRAQKLKQQRKEEQAQKEKEAKKDTYRKVVIVVASILVIGLTVGLVFLVNSLKEKESEKAVTAKQLILDTTKGEIVIDLFTADTPLTVEHIQTLVDQGFYDNLRWYRVEDGGESALSVVQTGSHIQSLKAESEGGEPDQTLIQEAYQQDQQVGTVLDELGRSNVRGAIGMAKPSDQQTQLPTPNSATTDFYILKQDATFLDQYFTVFGQVVKGMDVVDSLETTDVLNSARIKNK